MGQSRIYLKNMGYCKVILENANNRRYYLLNDVIRKSNQDMPSNMLLLILILRFYKWGGKTKINVVQS